MKKEYMLLIYNTINHLAHLSETQNQQFLQSCKNYIEKLKTEDTLIAAQPLAKEGVLISGTPTNFVTENLTNLNKERIQVGYYHILADSLNEAVAIAIQNPEFEFTDTASVEVRPIKTKEVTTGFVYPVVKA